MKKYEVTELEAKTTYDTLLKAYGLMAWKCMNGDFVDMTKVTEAFELVYEMLEALEGVD